MRIVGRVRAAQQRAWGYGDPATRAVETTDDDARRRFRNTALSIAPYNDIEFSGERKRVRCNEGLGGILHWTWRMRVVAAAMARAMSAAPS